MYFVFFRKEVFSPRSTENTEEKGRRMKALPKMVFPSPCPLCTPWLNKAFTERSVSIEDAAGKPAG